MTLSWNSLWHQTPVAVFLYGFARSAVSALRGLFCDAMFFMIRVSVPLFEHAECVVDHLACHQHLWREGTAWRWWSLGLIELLKLVCKCRALLRDVGFEPEGEVLVVCTSLLQHRGLSEFRVDFVRRSLHCACLALCQARLQHLGCLSSQACS